MEQGKFEGMSLNKPNAPTKDTTITEKIAQVLPKVMELARERKNINFDYLNRKVFAKKIGEGGYGMVYEIDYDQIQVAVKVLPKPDEREVEILRKISDYNHDSIVNFIGVHNASPYFIILELAESSLHDLLHGFVKEKTVIYHIGNGMIWSSHIADGVEFLHGLELPDGSGKPRPVLHRDLKPENILMFDDCKRAKITDFGLARLDASEKKSKVGTMHYSAPEVRNGNGDYNSKCDVYGAGAIIWEILNRKKIYDRELSQYDDTTPILKHLYQTSLLTDPASRPSMSNLASLCKRICRRCAIKAPHLIDSGPWFEKITHSWPPPTEIASFSILWDEWEIDDADKQLETDLKIISKPAPVINRVVVFGGLPTKVASSVCSVSTAGDDDWRDEQLKLPNPRHAGIAALLSWKRLVLLMAGDKSKDADIIQWDNKSAPKSNVSSINNVMIQSRTSCDAAAVESNTKIVIAGGHDDENCLKSAELFVESFNKCIELPDMNEERRELAMATDYTKQPNEVVATGGEPAKGTVERFDLGQMCWTVGPAMLEQRVGHAAASLGGCIYVAGGWRMKAVEWLDSRESRWQKTTAMHHARQLHRLLAVDDHQLFAIGGRHAERRQELGLSSVEVFENRYNTWTVKEKTMKTGRENFQAVVL